MKNITVQPVKKSSDAHYANCSTCGVLPGNQFWGPSTTRGLHISGTGHKVGYVRMVAES